MPPRHRPIEDIQTGWVSIGRVAGVFAFVLLLVCLAMPFFPRLREYKALDDEGRQAEAARDELRRQQQKREADLRLLETSPQFVELKARDRLDMYREGEVIFRFEDPKQ